ncbi:MAG: DUF721 domain-containing protein [Betaproteobacteria bacterium]|nr:DUF721 domain-containing protein [Betaproteobacteria bacterium]NBP34743.1 DUF721 domain-containing protein [Betaproteobacteria bacterium]NBP38703.1 DUF721 domain-containing protein [Betaproteobacteria bacterium]NBQ94529.1 DUF721 domain-containing protein [Betaproteobacteria bacterium]NBS38766.1 DUF721 domain-containing protein [Betaproteobacteria bacterium]
MAQQTCRCDKVACNKLNLRATTMTKQQHPGSNSRRMLNWLELDPQGAMLLRQAQTLGKLQEQLQAHTGLKLEVCSLRESVLVLLASGAMAARLRQQSPSLLRFLRSQGWSLEDIKIKARPYRQAPAKLSVASNSLSPAAHAALNKLQQTISDPGLAQSLKRLLRRAKVRSGLSDPAQA